MAKRRGPPVTQVEAVVTKVVPGTRAYVVTTADVITRSSITFSLREEVWHGQDVPRPGSRVLLSDIRPSTKGWRAYYVRPLD